MILKKESRYGSAAMYYPLIRKVGGFKSHCRLSCYLFFKGFLIAVGKSQVSTIFSNTYHHFFHTIPSGPRSFNHSERLKNLGIMKTIKYTFLIEFFRFTFTCADLYHVTYCDAEAELLKTDDLHAKCLTLTDLLISERKTRGCIFLSFYLLLI